MGDVHRLSNAELEKLSQGESATSLSHLSDEDLQNIANPKDNRSSGEKAIDYIAKVPGDFVDYVTAKPTASGLRKGLSDSLPATGTMAGEYAGSVGGLPGEIVGGGLGNIVGSMAKTASDDYSQGGLSQVLRPPTVAGTIQGAKDDASAFMNGMSQVMGGKIIGSALDQAAGAIKTGYKSTKDAVEAAAQRLGFEATPGMISSSPVVQGMESSLSQSPTIAGSVVRSDIVPVQQGLKTAAQNVVGDASENSAVQTGNSVSNGLLANFGEKYNNAQMAYEPFNAEMPKMIPGDDDKLKLASQIERAAKGNLSLTNNVEGFATKVADKVMNAKSLDDVEEVRKQVGNALRNAYDSRDYNAVDSISKIQDKLSDFRDNQFLSMSQQAAPGSRGAAMGRDMVSEYKNARQTFASMMEDMKSAGQALGIKANNPKAFMDTIAEMPPEQMSKKLFDSNNFEAMQKIQQYFPEEFEQVRQLKLGEIRDKSLNAQDQIDPVKLIRQYDKLRSKPEVRSVLFGDGADTIQDMKTVIGSIPQKIGPSGTPQGEAFKDIGPKHLVTQPIAGLQYGLYKTMGSQAYSDAMQNLQNLGASVEGQSMLGAVPAQAVNIMSKNIKSRSQLDK